MKVYKPKEAAKILNISLSYLKKLLQKGKIKGFKVGQTPRSHWRITEDEINKFTKK